ncbi:hypothetical protein [Paenibacillus sp. FSL R10-2736]|uniref:hypothetical protein n=1 Tax=Paenibacillus sp. FSL R10-2736 TaxID=2954692 RepID=UPI0030F63993
MIRVQGRPILILASVISLLLFPACGQNNAAEGSGQSFAAAVEASDRTEEPATEAQAAAARQPASQFPRAPVSPSPAVKDAPVVQSTNADSGSEIAEAQAGVTSQPSSMPSATSAIESAVAQEYPKKTAGAITSSVSPSLVESTKPQPSPGQPAKAKDTGNPSAEPAAKASAAPASSPVQPANTVNTAAAAPAGKTDIDWSGFFDGDDQTRPSEKFWDLSGSHVTIKGFMGEVLSFEKNWFLLIPEPGAECPFDNGDETYWNKIMIVFVPEGSKLRHTSGPLEISGRLDVGIKIDESGYKTMFRLYDASFKSL